VGGNEPIHPESRAEVAEYRLPGLADKLTAMGTPETDRNIANKISRVGSQRHFSSNV
jgi:hypothetical protein